MSCEPTAVIPNEQQPELSFNYLGQFDQVLQDRRMFKWVKGSGETSRRVNGHRRKLLGVVSTMQAGQLRFRWTYSANVHGRSTVEDLASGFANALRSIIADGVQAAT